MRLVFENKVTEKYIQETLVTQLKYYYPQISEIEFTEHEIIIQGSELSDSNTILKSVEKIVDKFKIIPKIPQKVFFDSENNDSASQNHLNMTFNKKNFVKAAESFIEFLTASSKTTSSPHFEEKVLNVRKGLNVYNDNTALLFQGLDNFFKDFYRLEFNADELKVPSMISTKVVDQAGYFETGCQHLSFVAPINNDPEKYDAFLPEWNKKGSVDNLFDYLKKPKDVLNPALCLHCYPLLEQIELQSDQLVSFTLSGSCFRDESGNLNNNERLNEFFMREAVFFGSPEKLKEIHQILEKFTILFGNWLGLKFRLEAATDIFFDENAQLQLFSQLASSNKIEFSVYSYELDKYISCGSINKHQNHFSKRFQIKDENQNFMSTMCIGFGFNRLILLLMNELRNGLIPFIEFLKRNLNEIVVDNNGREQ